jgi:hypothetical protein
VIVIVVNTLILGMDNYPSSEEDESWRELSNYFFLFVYCIEFLVKVLGLGWKGYFRDETNTFDLFVLVISLVELAISMLEVKIQAL